MSDFHVKAPGKMFSIECAPQDKGDRALRPRRPGAHDSEGLNAWREVQLGFPMVPRYPDQSIDPD